MKRLKASYTIEVSYVLAITLFALSTIIITAYREETRVCRSYGTGADALYRRRVQKRNL